MYAAARERNSFYTITGKNDENKNTMEIETAEAADNLKAWICVKVQSA
jgi:hypothetical protein